MLPHEALDGTNPVPVGDVNFRVYNASTQRNHAKAVATMFTELGMKQAADPDNDPIYPAGDMGCRGQIRFGAPGAAAARTLSLVEPCLELVRDDRQDASIDISIGKKFDDVKPNSDARKVLDQLKEWADQQPEQQGGQVAEADPADAERRQPGRRARSDLLRCRVGRYVARGSVVSSLVERVLSAG